MSDEKQIVDLLSDLDWSDEFLENTRSKLIFHLNMKIRDIWQQVDAILNFDREGIHESFLMERHTVLELMRKFREIIRKGQF